MVKKIYIDSNHRASGDESDFLWQMPYSERVPKETEVCIDQVTITNCFYTVGGHNKYLYWGERNTTANPDTRANFIETLTEGNYTPQTLGVHIKDKMNARSQANGYKNVYTVTYNDVQNTYSITKTGNTANPVVTADFTFWSNKELGEQMAVWASSSTHAYNALSPRSAYKLLGLPRDSTRTDEVSHTFPNQVNLIPHSCLYLHSSNMGDIGSSIGPSGEQTIIRRIPVGNVPFGNVIQDSVFSPMDTINLSGHQLSNLHFRLTDEDAHTVDLHGIGFSFSFLIIERE
jgi:hypothetical protein